MLLLIMGFFSSLIELFARIFISSLFIINGIGKILNYDSTIEYMSNYNVPSFLLIPAITLEIFLPILIIIGYKTRISALILAIFTVSLAMIFHSDFTSQIQTISFLKNIAITGGLLLLFAKEPGQISLDR